MAVRAYSNGQLTQNCIRAQGKQREVCVAREQSSSDVISLKRASLSVRYNCVI